MRRMFIRRAAFILVCILTAYRPASGLADNPIPWVVGGANATYSTVEVISSYPDDSGGMYLSYRVQTGQSAQQAYSYIQHLDSNGQLLMGQQGINLGLDDFTAPTDFYGVGNGSYGMFIFNVVGDQSQNTICSEFDPMRNTLGFSCGYPDLGAVGESIQPDLLGGIYMFVDYGGPGQPGDPLWIHFNKNGTADWTINVGDPLVYASGYPGTCTSGPMPDAAGQRPVGGDGSILTAPWEPGAPANTLRRLDIQGQIVWDHTFVPPPNTSYVGGGVYMSADCSVYIPLFQYGPGAQEVRIAIQHLAATDGSELIPNGGTYLPYDFQTYADFNNFGFYGLLSTGSDGVIVTWTLTDPNDSTKEAIMAQKLDATGNVLWASSGLSVVSGIPNGTSVAWTLDGAGGALYAWKAADSSGVYHIYAQHVTAAGVTSWSPAPTGMPIITVNNSDIDLQMVTDNAGGAMLAWIESATGKPDQIDAIHVTADGQVIGQTPSPGGGGNGGSDSSGGGGTVTLDDLMLLVLLTLVCLQRPRAGIAGRHR